MNRNILRGIVVLIVLLGIAGVFLLIDKDTETETVYNPPSEEEWQKIRQDLAAQKAAKAQSPEGNREKGHRHADGTWHDAPHDPAVVDAGNQPSFETDDTWRLYPDNTWRKKGERAIPNTVPSELKLPEDVFSEAYTDRVKKLVQTYVKYRNSGDLRSHALWEEIQEVKNAMWRLRNLYSSDKTNNRYALERVEELEKLLEPYNALIPKSNHPSPFEKYGDPREKYGGLPSKEDLDVIRQRRNR